MLENPSVADAEALRLSVENVVAAVCNALLGPETGKGFWGSVCWFSLVCQFLVMFSNVVFVEFHRFVWFSLDLVNC